MQIITLYGKLHHDLEFQFAKPAWLAALDIQYEYIIECGVGAEAQTIQLLPKVQWLFELEYQQGKKRWVSAEAFIATDITALMNDSTLLFIRIIKISARSNQKSSAALENLQRCFQPKTGLLSLDLQTKRLDFPEAEISISKPLLLFVHGVAASFETAFGDLLQPEQTSYLQRLWQRYEQIYAYEYHSLSDSFVQQALSLVEQLPHNTQLHVVAHGSGALLIELIAQVNEAQITLKDCELLRAKQLEQEAEALEKLIQGCQQKSLHIQRVIQIAAPMRGLSLANRAISDIATLMYEQMDNVTHQTFCQALLFTLHVDHNENNSSVWHHLCPDSSLIRLLNRPSITLKQTQMACIWGEVESERLPLWLQHYFIGEHDGVVTRQSMQGGANYTQGTYIYVVKASQHLHYHYFKQPQFLEALLSALGKVETDNRWQYQPFDEKAYPLLRSIEPLSPQSDDSQGVVVFLPGLLGSHLSMDATPVWLDLDALSWGDFTSLVPENTSIRTQGIIKEDYQAFWQHLSQNHQLIPFAYDWRQPHQDTIQQFAQWLEQLLEERHTSGLNYPIRFMAHSVGGLVVLGLMQAFPLLWQRLSDDADARLLLIGTPLKGSGSVLQLLKGEHRLVTMLDLLEGQSQASQLIATQLKSYSGLLELLPEKWLDEEQWLDEEIEFYDQLEEAQAWRQQLKTLNYDVERIVYVRGEADLTPIEPTEDTWLASRQGDSITRWQTIPELLTQWHLPLEHGAMLSVPRYFTALTELLDHGHTAHLNRIEPNQTVRDVPVRMQLWQGIDVFPNAADVRAAALGYFTQTTQAETLPPVQLQVTHGNLEHVRHALVVGHYQGDAILSAEKALDQRLNGRLQELHHLGVYPGELNTAEVFLNPNKQPQAAVVVGLGAVGKLTVNGLINSFSQGLLRYALSQREQLEQHAATTSKQESYLPLTISSLMIGTLGSGLTLQESLLAILRGIKRANQSLRELRQQAFLRFNHIEIIELYEDKALEAVRILRHLMTYAEFRDEFALNSWMQRIAGGFSRVTYNEPTGWWQRLQITGTQQGLHFLSLTDRARAESVLQATQRDLVDRFVNKAMKQGGSYDCDIGKVLFEMLLPNTIKDQTPTADSLVLVLNSESAIYPWELMHNRRDAELLPLSVRTGLIRQLQTTQFRETVINTTQRSAFVIGDPQVSSFKRLPAAQREARLVQSLLQQHGFDQLKAEIDTHADSILQSLFEQDYRVLHLAGHGVYRYQRNDGQSVTGMVIGDDAFLTAVEVKQMRKVPELVFVNCCHLGQVDDDLMTSDLVAASQAERHQFAASLAEALIAMGVRAVVVAGWVINDAAAHHFANTFYKALLSGNTFGQAVLRARRQTYDEFSSNNTWGAYQCYGDPDYRLILEENTYQLAEPEEAIQFLSEVEVISELKNLVNAADSSRVGEYGWVKQRLLTLHKAIPNEWLRLASVQNWLGRAYGKLDLFEEAITAYRRCIQAEKANYSVLMLEDLISIQTAYALHCHHEDPQKAHSLMQEAKRTLDWLGQLDQVINPPSESLWVTNGQTLQRLEEQGKYWKRLSMMQEGQEQTQILEQMQQAYWQAHEFAEEYLRRIATYPLLNALTCQVVREYRNELVISSEHKETLHQQLQRAKTQAERNDQHNADFCSAIALAETTILYHLCFPNNPEHSETAVINHYQAAIERGAPPRKVRFVREHLSFLIQMLSDDEQLVWLKRVERYFDGL